MVATLSNFIVLRPEHELDQETILEWVAAVHAESAKEPQVGATVLSMLKKIGLGKGKIGKRSIAIEDCLHRNWDAMEIYNTDQKKAGNGQGVRTSVFDRIATDILTRFYPVGAPLPSQLIHVTCTGYTAPSPAQKLVSFRDAGRTTTIIHAYHMGCYASIPAIRIAQGFTGTTEIVHTEICSIHMNPSFHTLDQLVVQSLFADGFIKYEVCYDDRPGFKVLAVQEEVLPESLDVMTWICDDWGMKMTLSKEIPLLIVRALPTFVAELLQKAHVSDEDSLYFAIHPGGPKIIEQIAQLMKLEPWQFAHSAHILNQCGNMSSATLPHIWKALWDDPQIPNGAKIVSLAFGPGLTLAGAVLQCKR
ncbi:MAG: 3-oxoacyl-[acyl-carrier-protein] synthase III C-terminal domain-containing protein [Rhabdochlamydiaceae bacterium]